jgi:hypothetical protein
MCVLHRSRSQLTKIYCDSYLMMQIDFMFDYFCTNNVSIMELVSIVQAESII